MPTPPPTSDAWAKQTVRNTLHLAAWTAAWVVSVAVAAFGPGAVWGDQPALTLVAIAASVLVGAGVLLANKRHLQGLDELQREMQLQVMGWTLGAGLVGGTAWSLLADLVAVEAGIAHVLVLMAVVYLIGSAIGSLRYR